MFLWRECTGALKVLVIVFVVCDILLFKGLEEHRFIVFVFNGELFG